MKLEIYHQIGYRDQWNFQSLSQDKIGKGVILAPRHMSQHLIEQMNPEELQDYLFDPQFFLPSVPKGQLATYDFFPHLASDGFSTSEYTARSVDSPAARSAAGCVAFQMRNGFRYLVIPTRHIAGTPSNYAKQLQELFVDPFMHAVQLYSDRNPQVLLQLIINEQMLRDTDFRADLLNWVTSLEIDGVYIILDYARRSKQIKDIDLLYELLCLIDVFVMNELRTVVGYTNTEALLLAIADPQIVTVGCYENTRMFNIRTFEDEDESKMQGPTPRLYVSRLMQWIDHRYIGAINRELGERAEELFDHNDYNAKMFQPTFRWHFTKPELYKHAILETGKQLRTLADLEGKERYEALSALINTARDWYRHLQGIAFDPDSDDSHLPLWQTAANQFAKYKGWR